MRRENTSRTAARSAGRVAKERADVERAEDALRRTREAFDAVTDGVQDYFESANAAGYANYGSCVEDLGNAISRDCDFLDQISVERARCRASTWLRAAQMCFELPCVTADEDGRLDRIFPR